MYINAIFDKNEDDKNDTRRIAMCKRLISKFMLRSATLIAPQCSMNNPFVTILLLFLFLLKVLSCSLSDPCKIHRGRPIFLIMSVVKPDGDPIISHAQLLFSYL